MTLFVVVFFDADGYEDICWNFSTHKDRKGMSMVTLPHRDTLIMVGAYSGRENTLTVVDVDPRFIAEIDPLSTIFCRAWETPFLY